MLNKTVSRRGFVTTGLGAITAAGLLPFPAFALTEAAARGLVDKLVADINKVIAAGKSESAMIKDFE